MGTTGYAMGTTGYAMGTTGYDRGYDRVRSSSVWVRMRHLIGGFAVS